MRYARDSRTKSDIDAHHVGERARLRHLSCPTCGGRVHYRRSSAHGSDPIFAHNPGEGRPDCENYFPGYYAGISIPSLAAISRPRPKAEIEDAPDELGLCLEERDSSWTLCLRFPELNAAELRSTSPRSLIGALVELNAAGERRSIPLVDLRPGSSAARLVVPPVSSEYKVTTGGTWPATVRERRWQSRSRGMNTRGTLFRSRHGEWVRLKEGSAVEFGEELRVVALQQNAPPPECRPEARSVISARGQMWRLWRVTLPVVSNSRFESWANAVGVEAVEPAWEIKFGSIPAGVRPEKGTTIFPTRKAVVARLDAPNRGAKADVTLSAGSSRHSDSFSLAPGSYSGFVTFTIAWAGSNELSVGYDERSVAKFDTEDAVDLDDLREALSQVPVLRVAVGDAVVSPWTEPYEIEVPRRDVEPPKIKLLPDLEDLRIGLRWKTSEGGSREEELSVQSATRRVNAFFGLRKEIEARIDAGPMGSVVLLFRVPAAKKSEPAVSKRKALWLDALIRGDEGGVPLPSTLIRQGATWNRRLANAARGNPRWLPVALRALKQSRD